MSAEAELRARVSVLERQLAEALAEIARLQARAAAPPRWEDIAAATGLGAKHAQVASILMDARGLTTPYDISDGVWPDASPEQAQNNVRVAMGHIRRALGSFGTIENVNRTGYRLSEAGRQALQAALAREDMAA